MWRRSGRTKWLTTAKVDGMIVLALIGQEQKGLNVLISTISPGSSHHVQWSNPKTGWPFYPFPAINCRVTL
jgi:hypothetical protein